MSKKGQLVVPAELRAMLGLNPEDRFIAYGEKDYIVFKRVELPSLKKEFEKVVEITAKVAKEAGITEDTVMEEIKAYRRSKKKAS